MGKPGWAKKTRKIGTQEFEIGNDDRIFHLEARRENRLNQLKAYVIKECESCWKYQDKKVATLKRQYLNELIASLE